jgi:25S rRNA (uracil2634-N3)-methyltransferase
MAKRRKLAHRVHPTSKKPTQSKSQSNDPSPKPKPRPKQQQHPRDLPPTIPFSPTDRILLIGEGDLSFAASLSLHHLCTSLTATVLEPDRPSLLAKYPHAAAHIDTILSANNKILYGIDATRLRPFLEKSNKKKPGLTTEPAGTLDRIIFNFPHVGGKSTDVNRQVRANQELLVSFFRRAMPSLAPGGSIVVTLFEGEPYTLWNIPDLGRHVGLQLHRSFRFRAEAYPGYAHSRTLGVVRNRKGEVGGGWKGEDRAARSYVFGRKEEGDAEAVVRKRRRGEDGSSSSSSDEDE